MPVIYLPVGKSNVVVVSAIVVVTGVVVVSNSTVVVTVSAAIVVLLAAFGGDFVTIYYSKNCSIHQLLKITLPGIGSVVEVALIFVAVEVVDGVEVVTVVELDVEFESKIEMIL